MNNIKTSQLKLDIALFDEDLPVDKFTDDIPEVEKVKSSETPYMIKQNRTDRIKDLRGKYVITTIGRASNQTVYLQDKKISDGGFWTQYLSNALGFTHESGALKVASSFKYGDPKVIRID